MYTLTPETLIRIEDASDPKRGFIMKPWGEASEKMALDTYVTAASSLKRGYVFYWSNWKLTHPDAITEVE